MKFSHPDWQWLHCIEAIQVDGDFESISSDAESLVIVMSGTYDVLAGGGSWLARGVRQTPHEGKPVALFLPPQTRFAFQNGHGELLIVASRQPESPPVQIPATSEKPLLALAGSGKAFDPASGEWKRQEDFPSSPEAILPRRIETSLTDGCILRHVAPFDYKALSLSLDEAILQADKSMTTPASTVAQYPAECAIYYDTAGSLSIGETQVSGRGVIPAVAAGTPISAQDSASHLVIAYAGPKLPS